MNAQMWGGEGSMQSHSNHLNKLSNKKANNIHGIVI